MGDGTWSWLLTRIVDNLDNAAELTWRAAGSQRYLRTGGLRRRTRSCFRYGPRPDPLRFGRGGFLLVTEERCTSIELRIPTDAEPLVRRWDLGYDRAEPNGASLLASVALTGRAPDGSELTAPALTFGYSSPRPATLRRMGVTDAGAMPPAMGHRDDAGRVELVDWTGDGLARRDGVRSRWSSPRLAQRCRDLGSSGVGGGRAALAGATRAPAWSTSTATASLTWSASIVRSRAISRAPRPASDGQ